MESRTKKILIGFLIVVLNIVVLFWLQKTGIFTFESIKAQRDSLISLATAEPLYTPLIFCVVYTCSAALALPALFLLIMLAGLLFGPLLATVYVAISATIGGSCVFMISRYLMGQVVQQKYGQQLAVFNKYMEQHGILYLLLVRLTPFIPFFLINIVAGITLVPFFTFFWTTFIGIIPLVFLYASCGKELCSINALSDILSPSIILIFCVLTLLSIIPVLLQLIRTRKE